MLWHRKPDNLGPSGSPNSTKLGIGILLLSCIALVMSGIAGLLSGAESSSSRILFVAANVGLFTGMCFRKLGEHGSGPANATMTIAVGVILLGAAALAIGTGLAWATGALGLDGPGADRTVTALFFVLIIVPTALGIVIVGGRFSRG